MSEGDECPKGNLARSAIVIMKHPTQPLYIDNNGIPRFKENKIIRFLLEAGPFDMNQLSSMEFSDEDRVQFAQLIGLSLNGLAESYYVSDQAYNRMVEESGYLKRPNDTLGL